MLSLHVSVDCGVNDNSAGELVDAGVDAHTQAHPEIIRYIMIPVLSVFFVSRHLVSCETFVKHPTNDAIRPAPDADADADCCAGSHHSSTIMTTNATTNGSSNGHSETENCTCTTKAAVLFSRTFPQPGTQ